MKLCSSHLELATNVPPLDLASTQASLPKRFASASIVSNRCRFVPSLLRTSGARLPWQQVDIDHLPRSSSGCATCNSSAHYIHHQQLLQRVHTMQESAARHNKRIWVLSSFLALQQQLSTSHQIVALLLLPAESMSPTYALCNLQCSQHHTFQNRHSLKLSTTLAMS